MLLSRPLITPRLDNAAIAGLAQKSSGTSLKNFGLPGFSTVPRLAAIGAAAGCGMATLASWLDGTSGVAGIIGADIAAGFNRSDSVGVVVKLVPVSPNLVVGLPVGSEEIPVVSVAVMPGLALVPESTVEKGEPFVNAVKLMGEGLLVS